MKLSEKKKIIKSKMIINQNDWHSLINIKKTAKENYLRIEEQLPGVTNYEAVKKFLQRLKKRPEKKLIFKNKPMMETKFPVELKEDLYQKSIFYRHKIKVEDNQSDVCGFSYEDYCRLNSSCYQHHCYNCTNSNNQASNFM